MRSGSIGEIEFSENTFEIKTIKIADIPKHRLEITGCCRLIEIIHYILEIIQYHILNGSLFGNRCLHYFVIMQVVIVTPLFTAKIVKIQEEFRRSHCTCKLSGYGEDHIDKNSAKTTQMFRRCRYASHIFQAVQKHRIHGNGYTIREYGCFVMLVQFMTFQLPNIFLCQIVTIQIANFIRKPRTIQFDNIPFEQFSIQGGNIFLRHIGIGIKFAGSSGIRRF